MKQPVTFFTDITAILDAAPDSLVIINDQGRIVHINTQTETLFGYTREELLEHTVEKLMPERYRHNHVAHRDGYFETPRIRPMGTGFDLYGLKKNGLEFPIEISLSPLTTDIGVLTLAAVRDVTDRKRFEKALREKNIELEKASLAKDSFLASMSHELRTPLNAIIGFTGTMLMRLPGPITPDQEKQLNTVRNSANHLLSLINDLLDLAKIESGKVELNFEEIVCQSMIEEVANVFSLQAKDKGLNFTVKVPDTPLIIKTDKRALSQIIINLVNNAIKFTDTGSIFLELLEYKNEENNGIKIAIIDTGIGIRTEDQPKLFNAFEQVHSKQRVEGTGLGLHLSQKLAELLGGNITFQSEWGKGSHFTLQIPKSEKKNGCIYSHH